MAWTDDRVAILSKLWAEGLSASQIAQQLGGVTRNAVIGKVHRLGLSGRATTSRMTPVRRRKRTGAKNATRRKLNFGTFGNTALKPDYAAHGQVKPHTRRPVFFDAVDEPVIPKEERVHLHELKECMCRWPIGDPLHEDFHFCARDKVEGTSYCELHVRRAFQPMPSRRRPPRQNTAPRLPGAGGPAE